MWQIKLSTGGAASGGPLCVCPTSNTTYTLACTSSAGVASIPQNATVYVNYPNLVAGNTSFSNNTPTSGTSVSFSAPVSNTGSATASNFPNVFPRSRPTRASSMLSRFVNASAIGSLAPQAPFRLKSRQVIPSAHPASTTSAPAQTPMSRGLIRASPIIQTPATTAGRSHDNRLPVSCRPSANRQQHRCYCFRHISFRTTRHFFRLIYQLRYWRDERRVSRSLPVGELSRLER